MANKHNNAGFTLMELLVTLGLISLVLVVGINLFLVMERNWQTTTASNLITGNYVVVLSRISRELRTAQSPNYSTDAVHVIDGQHMDIYNYDEVNGIYTRTNYRYNNGNLERGSVTTTNKFASANPQFATIGNYRTVLSGLTNTSAQPVFTDNTVVANSDRKVTQVHIITANMETSSAYTSRYQAEVLTADAIAALEVQVTAVTVSPETINPLAVNGTAALGVTVTPTNATNNNVAWTSSAPAIAAVDNSGNVTGIAAGTATITATADDGGLSDKCVVTVTVPVTGVTLIPENTTINKGKTQTLAATVIPANVTNQAVTWKSSNTSVATVNSSGTVTAVAGGTATITVTTRDGAKTDTCAVTVNVPVTGVSILDMSIKRNNSGKLTVTFSPSDASNKNFTCKSDSTKASVGTISGTSVTINAGSTTGTATITVTSNDGNYSDTCTVTIT
jgi:prepilin-type N-terminal cleavage/methylation domain-containing protein